jgi:tetratricopeptide (TPR) repeat protein
MLFFRSVAEVVQRAQKLKGEGKLDKAISTLEAVLSDSEDDFEPYLELGSLYCAKESYADAAVAYRNALSLLPTRKGEVLQSIKESYKPEQKVAELTEVLFETYIGAKDFESAVACAAPLPSKEIDRIAEKYRKMIKTSEDFAGSAGSRDMKSSRPREVTARYSLAMLAAARGNLAECFQHLNSVVKAEMGEAGTVEAEFKRYVTKQSKEGLPHIGFGDYYLSQGQVDHALREYQDALRVDKAMADPIIAKLEPLVQADPRNASAFEGLGDAYLTKRMTEAATAAYARVVQLDEKRIDSLIPKYKEITKLSAKDAAGFLALGDLHLHNKRYELAVTEYAKIPELDRSYLPQALDRYNQILAAQPDNAAALEPCVVQQIEAGELDKAVGLLSKAAKASDKVDDLIIEQLTHVLERDLHHVGGLDLLARLYLRRKSFTESLELYRHLVKLSPEAQGLAVQGLREIVRVSPSLLEAKIALGEALMLQDKPGEALAEFAAVVQRDNTLQGQVFPFLDKIMKLDKGLVEKVMEVYNSLQTAGSETLITLFAMGEAKAEKGDYKGSVEQFRKVLAQDPTKLDAVVQGYEKILKRNPGAGVIHLALADARIEKGQASEAIATLRSALAADQTLFEEVVFRYNRLREALPDDPEVRDAILEALFSLKVYDQAQEQAEQAVASGVEPAYPYLVLGRIQMEKGELTKSVTNLMRAVELRPDLSQDVLASLERIIAIDQGNIPAHYVLAKVQTTGRLFEKALDEYQLIARLDPQRSERVIADIKALLEEDKLNARGHFILADLHLRSGDPQEASLECDRTVDLDPEYLGKVIPIYQEIASRDPENAKANFALGKVQVQQGSVGPALESFRIALTHDKTLLEPAMFELRKVLDQDKDNCPARQILAGIYRQRGQRDQAAVLLQEILSLNPYGGEGALNDLEDLLSEDPRNSRARLALAEAYLARKDLGPAVIHLELLCDEAGGPGDLLPRVVEDLKAVAGGRGETQRKHPQALFVLGKALLKSGVAAEGVAALDAATRLDPTLREKAVPILDQALVTGLREVSVFKLLGLLRLEGKEYLKSAETFLAGIKSVKDKADAGRLYLCLSHSLAGLGDKKKSREALLQAHRISPEARTVEEEYQKLADRRLAIETQGLRKDLEASPEDLAARFRLAEALSEAGRHDEALGLLLLAEPQDPEGKLKAATLVGRIHVQRGQPGSAIELLRSHAAPEEISSEPGLSYHYWLARAYEAAGEWPQAYASYQRAAAGNPNYQDLLHRLPQAARYAVAMDLRQGAGKPRVLEKTL